MARRRITVRETGTPSATAKLAYGADDEVRSDGRLLVSQHPVQAPQDIHAAFLPSFNLPPGLPVSKAQACSSLQQLFLTKASRFGDAFTSDSGPLATSEFWDSNDQSGIRHPLLKPVRFAS